MAPAFAERPRLIEPGLPRFEPGTERYRIAGGGGFQVADDDAAPTQVDPWIDVRRVVAVIAQHLVARLPVEAVGKEREAEQQEILRRMQHSVRRLSRMSSAMFELSVGRQVKREPELRRIHRVVAAA